MDLRMPVLSGGEAIARIRELDPAARIVAITAYRHTLEEIGVPVLRKPFEPQQLFDAIDAALRQPAP
jgi:CheY-like chemotaxis protein